MKLLTREVRSIMEIALCSRSFEGTLSRGEMSFSDFVKQTKAHGISAIDVLASHIPDLESAKEVYHLLTQESMRVVSYSTRLTAISASSGELEAFENEFKKASILHSPFIAIRTNTGNEALQKELIIRDVLLGYAKLIDIAVKYSLKILIENNKGVSSSVESLTSIIHQFKGEMHVCLDTGNFPPNRRYSDNQRLIPLSAHCHFKTLDFDEEGQETTIDTTLCMMQLIGAGYSSSVAIEYEGGRDEKIGVAKSVSLLKKLFQIFNV